MNAVAQAEGPMVHARAGGGRCVCGGWLTWWEDRIEVCERDVYRTPLLHSLYFMPNGRVACINHMGNEARTAVERRPKARQWAVPDQGGYVLRASMDDRDEWLADMGEPLACENCGLS